MTVDGNDARLESETGHESQYADSILSSLRRVSRALELYSREIKRGCGLTGPQLVCLRELVSNGATTPGTMAKHVALSQATVTGILDRLEIRGLITRRRDTGDKRVVIVDLTEEGRELAEWAPPSLHPGLSDKLSELPEGEQALFDWVLRRIVEMMETQWK